MIVRRGVLTIVWLGSFAAALILIEGLIWQRTADGYHYILPQQRVEHMVPVIQIYSVVLGGILAFWFLKPFKKLRTDAADRARFLIAVFCTVAFNVVLIFLLTAIYFHWGAGGTALEAVRGARTVSAALAFIVAPINFYYFGMKLTG